MSNPVTLDSIRENVEKKYGSYDVEYAPGKVAKLQNAIRIPENNRKKMLSLQDDLKAEGADQVALLSDCIRAVAHNSRSAEGLLNAVNGDLATLVEIFSEYGKATQVGEASASPE